MLIKLPTKGPGIRSLESSIIKSIGISKEQDTVRDPVTFEVDIMDEKQKCLVSIPCKSYEDAEALVDTIATICNSSQVQQKDLLFGLEFCNAQLSNSSRLMEALEKVISTIGTLTRIVEQRIST